MKKLPISSFNSSSDYKIISQLSNICAASLLNKVMRLNNNKQENNFNLKTACRWGIRSTAELMHTFSAERNFSFSHPAFMIKLNYSNFFKGTAMKRITIFWILAILLGFTLTTCTEEETPTETPAPVCDQACKDEHVAYGLVDVFWFIWNQNIAGQPEGSKDFTVAGPQGGTVHVTGTTEVASNGINTLHLVLQFTNCKGIKEKYNLTFNGTVSADGTFSDTYRAVTYASQQLGYTGTVGKDDWVTNVNGFCETTINQTFTTTAGTICGRIFSY